jgi:hypothetical protein
VKSINDLFGEKVVKLKTIKKTTCKMKKNRKVSQMTYDLMSDVWRNALLTNFKSEINPNWTFKLSERHIKRSY